MNAQRFPSACGTMTVGRLQALLLPWDPNAEVLIGLQSLPTGVARIMVHEREVGQTRPTAEAVPLGYCEVRETAGRASQGSRLDRAQVAPATAVGAVYSPADGVAGATARM